MRRNFKVLVLPLLAVLAIGCVPAVSASAAEFHSEVEATKYFGESTSTFALDFTAGAFKCGSATLGGETAGKTGSDLSLTPIFQGCTIFGLQPGITTNGCTFTIGVTGSSPNFDGGFHLVCPAGQQFRLSVNAPTQICVISIPPQTPAGVLDYANQGSGSTRDFSITSTLTELKYTVEYPKGGPSICGTAGEHTDGKLTASYTMKGFKDAAHKEQVGVWIA